MTTRRVLCVSVVSLSLVCYGAYRYYGHVHQRSEWQTQQAFEAKLNGPVKIHFSQDTTLQECLSEWSRQTGVPATINEESIGWQARQLPPVTLPAGCTAGEALQILASLRGYSWIRDCEGVVFYQNWQQIPLTTATYLLPAGLTEAEERAIAHALLQGDRLGYLPGLENYYHRLPGAVAVMLPTGEHFSIRGNLAELGAALEQCAALPPQLAAPDDPLVQPIRIGENNGCHERLEQALERRVTLPLRNVFLKDFAARISQELEVPVVLVDSQDLQPGVTYEYCVNNTLRDVSLKTVLASCLRDSNLTYYLDEAGRSLHITTVESSSQRSQVTKKIYPVGDLLGDSHGLSPLLSAVRKSVSTSDGHFHGRCNFGPLIGLVQEIVEPDSWDETGGPGRITGFGQNRALLVTQRPDVHDRLFEFLTRLRRVRAGLPDRTEPWSRSSRNQSREFIRNLSQRLALEYSEVSWEDLIADVQKRSGLPIKLAKSIEDLGIKPTDKITVALPERELLANLQALLKGHHLRLVLRHDYAEVTGDNTGYEHLPERFEYELFDVRRLQSQPGVRAEIRNLLRKMITPDFWREERGPAFISEIGGVMVIQHEAGILNYIRPLMATLLADVGTDKLPESNSDLIDARAKGAWGMLAGFEEPVPVCHLYCVADLLMPRGRFSPDELFTKIEKLQPGGADSVADAWSFDLRLGHYLHVRGTPENAKKVEALLKELRKPAAHKGAAAEQIRRGAIAHSSLSQEPDASAGRRMSAEAGP